MNSSTVNAVSYLIGTLIDLYIAAVLLRLLLQWVRADFYNPLCQFLVKVTNPALVPLRRVIPSFKRLDTASVVLMLLLEILEGLNKLVLLGPLLVLALEVCADLFGDRGHKGPRISCHSFRLSRPSLMYSLTKAGMSTRRCFPRSIDIKSSLSRSANSLANVSAVSRLSVGMLNLISR